MEKPARKEISEKCREALSYMKKYGYEKAVIKYPDCKEELSRYQIASRGVDE